MPPTFNSGVVMMLIVLVVTMMEVFIIKHHIMLIMMKITVTFFINFKQMLDISMVVVTVLGLVSMSWMSVTVLSSEAADCRHPGKSQDHYHCP